MKKLKKSLVLILVLIVTTMAAGCGGNQSSSEQKSDSSAKQEKAVTLTVSAAASLKDSMNEIKQLYVKEHPNVTITYNFGSSGTLQQQIEQGAPADVFLSAATKQMNALKDKNLLVNNTIADLLKNDVVLIVPKNSSSNVKSFNDLASDKVKKIALGEFKSVPAGQYAQQILTNLKLMDKVQPKAIYGKDVKEVLTWVETGNADAGIVYKTDALISKKVNIVATAPEGSHKAVVYPAAVIKASKNPTQAKDFLKFLSSDKAKAVFQKYGFKLGK
jgi:molybdate transport system substrate-binding protein